MVKNKKTKQTEDKKYNSQRNTPFKNPEFSVKRHKNKSMKTLKQIVQYEQYDLYPASIATYSSIEAGPSTLPAKKYCDISGHVAKYQDMKTGLRFCMAQEFNTIRQLTQEHVDSLLSLRKAAVVIR